MDYRTLLIQLVALAVMYLLLHNDNVAILKALSRECKGAQAPSPVHESMSDEDKAIADAIFGSIAAPLFARQSVPPQSAHVEEVKEEEASRPVEAANDSPRASAESAVRRQTPKKQGTSVDVPDT